MAILPIILAPDPVLKRRCLPVESIDRGIRRLMETMYDALGVGLAAPQIAVHKRIIVADVSDLASDGRAPLQMANPEIIGASDEILIREEGCLSFPEHYADVQRPASVRVRYLDHDNEIQEIDAEGLLSVCIQHEMDHLDGVVFVDHLTSLKRSIILRKMSKLKRAEATAGR
jgi:peptide deformylase